MDDLDRGIQAAHRRLTLARTHFASNPSGEAFEDCEQAEQEMNDLLDRRYILQMTASVPLAVAA